MTWNGGAKYNGDWASGNMNGYGVFTYSNGGKYSGQWVDSKEEGYGVKEWLLTQELIYIYIYI